MNGAIAVFASARRHGNTGKLMDAIVSELSIPLIDLDNRAISPYDYEHRNIGDDFLPTMDELLRYETLIFATPVYWYGPSAQMKIFIDRTSDFLDLETLKNIGRQLRGKTAYVVCTSISDQADSSFINAFRSIFDYLGIHYGGHLHANCSDGYIQAQYQKDIDGFINRVRGESV